MYIYNIIQQFFGPLCAEFFSGTIKMLFLLFLQCWNSTRSWNLSLWKISTHLSNEVNIMAAYDLTMQGARASTAMVLPMFSWNVLATAPEGLIRALHFALNCDAVSCYSVNDWPVNGKQTNSIYLAWCLLIWNPFLFPAFKFVRAFEFVYT